MKWVTRERPKIDRIAYPWLILRFVDKDAKFLSVPADQLMAVAERENAIPYDVLGVELPRDGSLCSFDAILKKCNMNDPALRELAVRGDLTTGTFSRRVRSHDAHNHLNLSYRI